MQKTDYYVGALAGFLTGVFLIPIAVNLEFLKGQPVILFALPLLTLVLFIIGVGIGNFLGKKFNIFRQLSRFAAVGLLNTTIDFGILNILSLLSGVASGFILGGINIPGFLVAVSNSYVWNKLWVFKDRDRESFFHDLPRFLVVTVLGMIINSAIIILATTYIPSHYGLPKAAWLNLAKVAATAITLFWNFLGYKLIVFKK